MEAFKIGVNCILIQDNKVLLGKRLHKYDYGTWAPPGGHVELGESFIAAARRELWEETNLVADELAFTSVVNMPEENAHWVHINFLVSKWHGVLENKEPDTCDGWEWFLLNDLPKNISPFQVATIPSCVKKLLFVDDVNLLN